LLLLGVILGGCAQESLPVSVEPSQQKETDSEHDPPINPAPSLPVETLQQSADYVSVDWDHDSNLLENGSFEEGREPWFALNSPKRPYWMDFEVTEERALSGSRSALFRVHSQGEIHRGARIWGVIYDLEPDTIPRHISGSYLVEDWRRGAVNQYLQVVVCVFDPIRDFPELGGSPVQISFVLAGIDSPPFRISNRKFIFVGPKEPASGEWVNFDFDIHAAFKAHWGRVPKQFGKVRVFFEARFDERRPAPDLNALVWFDDLYLGDGG